MLSMENSNIFTSKEIVGHNYQIMCPNLCFPIDNVHLRVRYCDLHIKMIGDNINNYYLRLYCIPGILDPGNIAMNTNK